MMTSSNSHSLIPVATTPEEFDECFASDEEFFSYPGTCPAGFPQDDPIAREMWKEEFGD